MPRGGSDSDKGAVLYTPVVLACISPRPSSLPLRHTGVVHTTATWDGIDFPDFSVTPQEPCIFFPQTMESIDS